MLQKIIAIHVKRSLGNGNCHDAGSLVAPVMPFLVFSKDLNQLITNSWDWKSSCVNWARLCLFVLIKLSFPATQVNAAIILLYFSGFWQKGCGVPGDNKKRAPDNVISHALPKSADNVCGGEDRQFRHLLVTSTHYRENKPLLSGSGIDSALPGWGWGGGTITHSTESTLLVGSMMRQRSAVARGAADICGGSLCCLCIPKAL